MAIISPLLFNSLILSYISRARGQEILQFANRSTLCKGDYCIADNLGIFVLTRRFPFLCIHSFVSLHWQPTEHFPGVSITATQTPSCRVNRSASAYHHGSVLLCSHGDGGHWETEFLLSRDRDFCGQSQGGRWWDNIIISKGLTSGSLRSDLHQTMLLSAQSRFT